MRRFVTLVVLLLFSIPFGVSITGCTKNASPTFCNGGDSGIVTGQVTSITLTPIVYGISLNYAEIGQISTPSATDCKGSTAAAGSYTYGTTDMTIADVQPTSGRICGGTWNRNSGGGIPDYTYCIPANKSGTAYISASAGGVTSNPLPIFVHPVVTSIVLGAQSSHISEASITAWSITSNEPTFTAANSFTAGQVIALYGFNSSTFFNGITNAVVQPAGLSSSQFSVVIPGFTHANASNPETGVALASSCATSPTLDCGSASLNSSLIASTNGACPTSAAYPFNAQLANGCCVVPPNTALAASLTPEPPYLANSCLSQGATAQLQSQVFAGTGSNQTNISCQTGHLQYSAQGASSGANVSSVVSIDQNGVATANQPGSVLITADVADASSSAGFFSTCPPTSITLSTPGATTNPVVVNQNNPQPLQATAVDQNGVSLTGLSLEYVSTSPTTIPASADLVPILAGSASIAALCQPPSCNSAAYSQIGLFGNGKPITSNSVNITAPGTNSTVLYMASTQSLYMESKDFTQPGAGAPFLLPFLPNSMVISDDGSTIYMGSSTGLMVVNAVNTLSLTRADITSPGVVLAVSPDDAEIVISDPVKQITTIESTSGSIISTYGGYASHAEFTPDVQTVYITAGNQLLVYSNYTGWTNISPATSGGTPVTDVAITVPGVGAYFAGPVTTARGYCPISTSTGPTTESNVFYPSADDTVAATAITDRIAATNNGLHILGATFQTPTPTLSDLRVTIPIGACPAVGGLTFSSTLSTTLLSRVTPTTVGGVAPSITGVLPTSDSTIAFITYNGTGGVLPAYTPAASGAGSLTYIPLSGTAIAPVAGVISADNTTVYVGTTGDNLVHLINRGTLTDSSTLTPNLTGSSGAAVPINLLAQKPRRTT